jgi:hypothetical protein
MNRHSFLKLFQRNIAFILLLIISSIFIFTAPAFAVTETINYSYDDARQVVKAVYADGTEVMLSTT